ncbi:hypothetical protein D3C80_1174330 [compost metagenome]
MRYFEFTDIPSVSVDGDNSGAHAFIVTEPTVLGGAESVMFSVINHTVYDICVYLTYNRKMVFFQITDVHVSDYIREHMQAITFYTYCIEKGW